MTVAKLEITSREEWLQWRKPVLTASDIGAAAGVDQFKAPLQLYLEKALGQDGPGETSLMRRGKHFEPAVIEYLKEEFSGWLIERPNVFLLDAERRLGATPDVLMVDSEFPDQLVNCQIKVVTATQFAKWGDEPPLSYMLQCSCENLLLNAHSGILAVLVVSEFDAELVVFDVPRHAGAEDRMLGVVAGFWHAVDNKLMPSADYRRDAEAIISLYPPNGRPEGPPLDLSGDNRIYEVLERRAELKGLQKGTEAELEALDTEIVAKLAGAELAVANGWKITRKMAHRKEYVVKAADYPTMRIYKTT